MPPGLSSTLFITYQPGGTVIRAPSGSIVTEFDNTDLYDATHDADPMAAGVQLEPGLAGVVNGVFSKIGKTELIDSSPKGCPMASLMIPMAFSGRPCRRPLSLPGIMWTFDRIPVHERPSRAKSNYSIWVEIRFIRLKRART